MPLSVRRGLLPVCALASLACSGGDLVLPADSGPASMVIIKGNAQTGVAGTPLPDSLVVEVTDPQNRPVSGIEVAFLLGAGAAGGQLVPETATTGADGRAGARWVLGGTAGAQAVTARVVGTATGSGLVVTFAATASAAAPQAIAAFSGDNQTAPVGTALAESLVVKVTDQFGNPVSGVAVQWAALTGSVSPPEAATGADGRAATRRILGSAAGAQTATATAPGLNGSPVTFTHTAVPGTAASLVLVSGNDQFAPPGTELPDLLVVRLVDADGNGIPARAVSWLVGIGGGSIAPLSGATDGDGYASASFTLGPAPGTNTVNAVVSGVGFVTFTATATVGGGGPSATLSTISAAPTTIQAISGSSTITVTVRDEGGAPVPGATVQLSATGSGNTLGQPAGPTGAGGVVTGTLTSTVPGTKVVSATVNGTVAITGTAQVTVTLAPATAIVLVAGNNQTVLAGSAVPVRPSVKVTNALGQGIAGYGVTFVVTGGGGIVIGGSQTTNTDGVATVGSWTLGVSPGVNTLEAQAPGLAGSPVVFTATGTPVPDHLVFQVQPASPVVQKRTIKPAVEVAVVDKDGNVTPISGIVIHMALVPIGGDLRGATDQTTVNGVAVFGNLKVNHSGTGYVLVASVGSRPDLGQAQSAPFDVTK